MNTRGTQVRPTERERNALMKQLKQHALAGDSTAAAALAGFELVETLKLAPAELETRSERDFLEVPG